MAIATPGVSESNATPFVVGAQSPLGPSLLGLITLLNDCHLPYQSDRSQNSVQGPSLGQTARRAQ